MGALIELILKLIGHGFENLLERIRLAKLRRRRRANHCIRCDYDLRGTTGRCPECGNPRDHPIC